MSFSTKTILTLADGVVLACAALAIINLVALGLLWMVSDSFLAFLDILDFARPQTLRMSVIFSLVINLFSIPLYALLWAWSKMMTLQEYKYRLVSPSIIIKNDVITLGQLIVFAFIAMFFLYLGTEGDVEFQTAITFSIIVLLPYIIGAMFGLFTQALVVSGLMMLGYWIKRREHA